MSKLSWKKVVGASQKSAPELEEEPLPADWQLPIELEIEDVDDEEETTFTDEEEALIAGAIAENADEYPDIERRHRVSREFIRIADRQRRCMPEAEAAYQRLVAQGYSDFDARRFIANLVACAFYDVMKEKKPWNRNRYIAWLEQLPELPED